MKNVIIDKIAEKIKTDNERIVIRKKNLNPNKQFDMSKNIFIIFSGFRESKIRLHPENSEKI